MELQHVNAKIFVDGQMPVDPGKFIETFHHWIREQAVEGLLLDVADYRHVPEGPGVMLIGLDCDYSMDHADGRWGMLYNRKAGLEGSNADRLQQAVQSADSACRLLETEFDGLKFDRQQLEIKLNDRALAPNTKETFEACRGELETFLSGLFGPDQFSMEPEQEPRRRFGVQIKAARPYELAG